MFIVEPKGTHFLYPASPKPPYLHAASVVGLALHRPGWTAFPSAFGLVVRIMGSGTLFAFTERTKRPDLDKLDAIHPANRLFQVGDLGELIDNTPEGGCNLVVSKGATFVPCGLYRPAELDEWSWRFVDYAKMIIGFGVELCGERRS